jgi:NADH-quinone oxidoreductase subunit H
LLSHAWLVQPDNLFTVVQVLLGLIAAAATLAGFKLLKWHRTNRLRWKDARGREGAVLAVLLGFGPAFTAGLLLLLSIGKSASPDAAAIGAAAIQFLAFAGKTLFFCWLFVWVRWSVPRFRYDQIMGLGWKVLLPLGVAQLLVTALLVQLKVF